MLMVWFVPPAMTPVGDDALNQLDVITTPQARLFVPRLVRVIIMEAGWNGPPRGPEEMNPVLVLSRKSSVRSKASTTPVVVELAGPLALKPIPRFAKAFHKS